MLQRVTSIWTRCFNHILLVFNDKSRSYACKEKKLEISMTVLILLCVWLYSFLKKLFSGYLFCTFCCICVCQVVENTFKKREKRAGGMRRKGVGTRAWGHNPRGKDKGVYSQKWNPNAFITFIVVFINRHKQVLLGCTNITLPIPSSVIFSPKLSSFEVRMRKILYFLLKSHSSL